MKNLMITITMLSIVFLSPAVYATNFAIGIQDFQFSPSNITVGVGDSVTWTNNGSMSHTSTSGGNCIADSIWDSGLIDPGKSFTRTFTSAGTFPFHCSVDSHCSLFGMQGSITVNATPSVMPLPNSPLAIPAYAGIVSPVLSTDPTGARPVAVGSAAQGGNTFTLQIDTLPFTSSVDVYVAISAPALTPDLFLLTPGGLQTLASAGLVPWMTNVPGVNSSPFGAISVSLLPPATYTLFLAITPAGTLGAFDLWQTSFTVNPQTPAPIYTYPY